MNTWEEYICINPGIEMPPQLHPELRSGDAAALNKESRDRDVAEENNDGKQATSHRIWKGILMKISHEKGKIRIYIDSYPLLVDCSTKNAVIIKLSFTQLMDYTSKFNRYATRFLKEVHSFVSGLPEPVAQIWNCCLCGEKMRHSERHFQHVQSHMAFLSVDTQWSSIIEGGQGSWKAIDAPKAMLLLQSLLEEEKSSLLEEDEDFSEEGAIKYLLEQSWPLSQDVPRQCMLRKIHNGLQLLLSHKLLTYIHLEEIAQYSLNKLESEFPTCSALEHLASILDQMHLCICFLRLPELETIFNFLKSIAKQKFKSIAKEKLPSPTSTPAPKDEIFFYGDKIRVQISDDSLRGLVAPETYADMQNHRDRLIAHLGAFRRWILEGVWSEEQLDSCMDRIIQLKARAAYALVEHERKTTSLIMKIRKDGDLQFKKRDALLVQTFNGMENWILRTINPADAVDCRQLLLTLVKSYLQAFLEDDGFCEGVKGATRTLNPKIPTLLSKEVTVSKDDRVVTDGAGDKKAIEGRCSLLSSAIELCTSDCNRANISDGVTILKIGRASEVEVGEKDRVTDAPNATKTAVEEVESQVLEALFYMGQGTRQAADRQL